MDILSMKRILCRAFIFTAVYTGGSFAQPIDASDGYQKWLKSASTPVIKNSRNSLVLRVNRNEKEIIDDIRVTVASSWNVNAFAFYSIQDGERRVRIDMGYLSVLDQLSIAWVVDGEFGLKGCYVEYAQKLLDVISKNTEEAQTGQVATHQMQSVWTMGQDPKSDCYGITPERFKEKSHAGEAYARSMEAALIFVLFHEYAHHVLGHVDSDSKKLTKREMRQFEAAADLWSFSKSLEIKVNPIASSPAWLFFSSIDGNDLKGELESTHPLNLRRYETMLQTVVDANETESYKETFGSQLEVETIKDMEIVIKKIDAML